ncbi:MAG: SHOCT domain-containing protein [Nocardioidaceae bacterium]|nr:SHOCT domain-containing protein [Nocardioidaceae bacterium]
MQRRQQQRWAAQDAASQQMLAPVHPAPVVPAPPVAEDPMVTQLKQLAELRDAGVLTEEEFAAKKAKLLGI